MRLVALAGSDGSVTTGGIAVFAVGAAIAYVINWIVFIPSSRAKTEKYYDLTGSITYLSVIGAALVLSSDLDVRAGIAAAMVAVWALRLGTFLFRRVRRDGKDGRFDEIKLDPLRFFMAWTLQGLWVLLTVACALAIVTAADRKDIEWVAVVGIVVWLAGFAIEVVADRQKSAFRRDPSNDGRFITTGCGHGHGTRTTSGRSPCGRAWPSWRCRSCPAGAGCSSSHRSSSRCSSPGSAASRCSRHEPRNAGATTPSSGPTPTRPRSSCPAPRNGEADEAPPKDPGTPTV